MTQEPKSSSKAASLQRLLGQLVGIAQAVLAALGKLWWNTVLPFVQGLLPSPWNRRLSKPVLTGIAVALLTLVLWLTSTLNRPAVSSVDRSPTAAIDQPTNPQATRPEPALSPEKLTRLQERLTQVAEPYGEALIASVNPSTRHRLTLILDDRWYGLSSTEQDRLARELWDRAQKLDYAQLEILDLEDQRLARSPVVGDQMLIVKRIGRLPALAPQGTEEVSEPALETVEEADKSSLEPVSESTSESALEPDPAFGLEPSLKSVLQSTASSDPAEALENSDYSGN